MAHLGAVTYNVLKDWDLETLIAKLEAAGYEAVELRTSHAHGVEPSLGPAERRHVRERFERSKVRLLSFGSTAEFHSPDAEVRKRNVTDAKAFIDLAHDTGAWGVKVRPNGFPKGVAREVTIARIGECLRELGDYGAGRGIETWLEVHGPETQEPAAAAAIMRATNHKNVGLCWNSNPTDVVNGSVKQSFGLLGKWIRNCHITELHSGYPYREFFALLKGMDYQRYTLAEIPSSCEPVRLMKYYKKLWQELQS